MGEAKIARTVPVVVRASFFRKSTLWAEKRSEFLDHDGPKGVQPWPSAERFSFAPRVSVKGALLLLAEVTETPCYIPRLWIMILRLF